MTINMIAIDQLPQLAEAPAAFGALVSPMQISGGTIFDIVIAAILIAA